MPAPKNPESFSPEDKGEDVEKITIEKLEDIRKVDKLVSQLENNNILISRLKGSIKESRKQLLDLERKLEIDQNHLKESCEGGLNVVEEIKKLLGDKELSSFFSDERLEIIDSYKKQLNEELEKIEDKE